MHTLELIQVDDSLGASLGIALPPELLAELRIDRGDTLYLTESAEGFTLTARLPETGSNP